MTPSPKIFRSFLRQKCLCVNVGDKKDFVFIGSWRWINACMIVCKSNFHTAIISSHTPYIDFPRMDGGTLKASDKCSFSFLLLRHWHAFGNVTILLVFIWFLGRKQSPFLFCLCLQKMSLWVLILRPHRYFLSSWSLSLISARVSLPKMWQGERRSVSHIANKYRV